MKKGLNCSDFNKNKDNNSEMNLNTTKNQKAYIPSIIP
jgi:hypothetical protein